MYVYKQVSFKVIKMKQTFIYMLFSIGFYILYLLNQIEIERLV